MPGNVTFKLRAKGLTKLDAIGSADPYLRISRKSATKPDEWDMVFKGVPDKGNLNPEWPEFVVSMDELNGGDENLPLLFEVLDYDAIHKMGPEGMQDDVGFCDWVSIKDAIC